MQITLEKSSIFGQIPAPKSKSYLHRALICAALSRKTVKFAPFELSDDVNATLNCMIALGCRFENFTLIPPEKFNKKATLNAGESGSTLRFMICVAAVLDGEYELTGAKRLLQRPNSDLIEALINTGATVSQKSDKITVKGVISAQNLAISCKISSQFASGLMLALPYLNRQMNVDFRGEVVSKPYLRLTKEVTDIFGAKIDFQNSGFTVNGGYLPELSEIDVEGDWSNAAFLLSGAALSGCVTVTGLSQNSVQGDKIIVEILRKFGAKATFSVNSVIVNKGEFLPIELDCADYPDLAPVVAVLAASANGTSVIKRVSRLKDKESDRIKSVVDLVNSLGGRAKEENDCIIIEGTGLKGGVVNSYGDHRIAMSAAIAALVCDGAVTIEGTECVAKSYPNFFEDYVRAGGKVNVDMARR